jgi:hypothetical protein
VISKDRGYSGEAPRFVCEKVNVKCEIEVIQHAQVNDSLLD